MVLRQGSCNHRTALSGSVMFLPFELAGHVGVDMRFDTWVEALLAHGRLRSTLTEPGFSPFTGT